MYTCAKSKCSSDLSTMKYILLLIFTASVPTHIHAQRQLDESIALQGATQVMLAIEDAQLIRIDTTPAKEVIITGAVSINAGQNDDAYQVSYRREAKKLIIEASVKDEKSLPQRITLHQDGQDYILNASNRQDSVVQQFIREKGGYDWMSTGVLKDIRLQIKVPATATLEVESKFGTVEVAQLTPSLQVECKFGDIEVHIDPKAAITLLTNAPFGTVYTNLDWDFKKEGTLTSFKKEKIEGTLNGGGIPLRLHARFGNVYLRGKKD